MEVPVMHWVILTVSVGIKTGYLITNECRSMRCGGRVKSASATNNIDCNYVGKWLNNPDRSNGQDKAVPDFSGSS